MKTEEQARKIECQLRVMGASITGAILEVAGKITPEAQENMQEGRFCIASECSQWIWIDPSDGPPGEIPPKPRRGIQGCNPAMAAWYGYMLAERQIDPWKES